MGRKAVWWVTETLLVWISVFFALASLGTMIAPKIKPVDWEFGYLLTLLTMPILIGNVCFLLLWLIRRYWTVALIPLAGIVMLYPSFSRNVNWQNQSEKRVEKAECYVVASYNIHEFRGEVNIPGSVSYELKELMDQNKVDVICFQEFKQAPNFTADTIARLLEMPYFALANADKGMFYDVAIYSKYPIVDQGLIDINSFFRVAQWAKIRLPQGDIYVVNCHLQSTELFVSQKALRKSIKEFDMGKIEGVIQRQVDRLIQSSKVRTDQAQKVVNYSRGIDQPLLLCGDFNSPPNTYTYNLIVQRLSDSFDYSDNMTEPTYAAMKQNLRIDYVFYNAAITPLRHWTVQADISDHYPVLFQFQVGPEQ